MSDIANGIITDEAPQQCDYCGKIAELRPYGKNGACICYPCGMQNERETREQFNALLNQFDGDYIEVSGSAGEGQIKHIRAN